jgi:hypothetical protein
MNPLPLPLHLLIEVEPVESTSVKRRSILVHKSRDRRGRILFRLFRSVLILAKAVTPAPGDIVFHQLMFQIRCIDVECELLSANTAGLSGIPVWDTKPAALVINKPIK